MSTAGQCSSGISEFLGYRAGFGIRSLRRPCPAQHAPRSPHSLLDWMCHQPQPSRWVALLCVCALLTPSTQPGLLEQCQGGLHKPARSPCRCPHALFFSGRPPASVSASFYALHPSPIMVTIRSYILRAERAPVRRGLPRLFIKLDRISYVVRPSHFHWCLLFSPPFPAPFPAPPMGKAHSPHAALSCRLYRHTFSASVPSYLSGSGPP